MNVYLSTNLASDKINTCDYGISTTQDLKDTCGDTKYHVWMEETGTCVRYYSDTHIYADSNEMCARSAPIGAGGRLAHVTHNFYPQFNYWTTRGWIGLKRYLMPASWVPKATVTDYRSLHYYNSFSATLFCMLISLDGMKKITAQPSITTQEFTGEKWIQTAYGAHPQIASITINNNNRPRTCTQKTGRFCEYYLKTQSFQESIRDCEGSIDSGEQFLSYTSFQG